jgi:hypothetical protein
MWCTYVHHVYMWATDVVHIHHEVVYMPQRCGTHRCISQGSVHDTTVKRPRPGTVHMCHTCGTYRTPRDVYRGVNQIELDSHPSHTQPVYIRHPGAMSRETVNIFTRQYTCGPRMWCTMSSARYICATDVVHIHPRGGIYRTRCGTHS